MDLSEADRLRLLEAGRKLLEERRRAPQPRSTSVPSPAPVAAATSPAQVSVAPSVPVTSVPSLLGSSSGDDEARLRAKTAAQNKRIDQLTAENKDLVARIDQLERNTLEICSENNGQRSRLDDALKRCRQLEEENSHLRSELQAPSPADELATLRRELDEKTATARDLQRRLAQSETTATQRARTIDSLEEDLRSERIAHSAAVRLLEEKLAAALARPDPPPVVAPAPTPSPPVADHSALATSLAKAQARIATLTQECEQLQAVAERSKQLEAQLERANNEYCGNAAQKQVLMRTHQLELQHAEETKAREVQSRLNTASASVQQTLSNLQASNASLQTANTQLEHQLRERKEEINELNAKLAAQGSALSSSVFEQKTAELVALKKELATSKQTCDETLALAEALQQTMDLLLQNGQAQEDTIATLQGRLRKAELDKEELRVAQEADAQRVRQAVAEATAAGEQPTTLEELQEQKIIQLLAQIAALEVLLRERTETISKLREQQFELAYELEKSKKTSGKYWSEQQTASSSAEALHAQHKALLKELNDIRAALRTDQRRAVLIPDIIDRLDAIVSRDSAPVSVAAAPKPSPVVSVPAPTPSVSVAPATSPPAPTSQVRQVPSSAEPQTLNGHAHESDEDENHDHHGHSHAHGHAHSSKAHTKTHSAPQVVKPQKRGFRDWIFGRRSADPLPTAPANSTAARPVD